LLSGTPPFGGDNDDEITAKIKSGKYSFDGESWNSVSSYAKNLIKKMLVRDQNKRPTAQECLEDVWFTKVLDKQEIDKPLAKENLERLRNFRTENKL